MAGYQVLARKYRPQKFSELIGQDVLVQTLTNAIQQNKIHHAFILTGIRGTGKTSTARIIAKSLNCIGKDGKGTITTDPCLECEHCKAIANSIDQDVIEFDAASHTGVNDIREIIDTVNYAPVSSRYKVYIIDEVHMLSNSAFNALLKTLEEPPAHVKFIFATTEIRKVPITILSRCIRFDLNRVSQDELAKHLEHIAKNEGYEFKGNSIRLIAGASEGSVRDSLSIMDRVISFNNFENVIEEEKVLEILGMNNKTGICNLYEKMLSCDTTKTIELFNEIYLSIVNYDGFVNDLLELTHNLIMKKTNNLINNISLFENEWLDKNCKNVGLFVLFRIWQILLKSSYDIKNTNNYKNFLEILLLKIIYCSSIPDVDELIKKLQNNFNSSNIENVDKSESLTDKILSTIKGVKIIN